MSYVSVKTNNIFLLESDLFQINSSVINSKIHYFVLISNCSLTNKVL